jgi:hypothetical protein
MHCIEKKSVKTETGNQRNLIFRGALKPNDIAHRDMPLIFRHCLKVAVCISKAAIFHAALQGRAFSGTMCCNHAAQ